MRTLSWFPPRRIERPGSGRGVLVACVVEGDSLRGLRLRVLPLADPSQPGVDIWVRGDKHNVGAAEAARTSPSQKPF